MFLIHSLPSTVAPPSDALVAAAAWWEDPPLPEPAWSVQDFPSPTSAIKVKLEEFSSPPSSLLYSSASSGDPRHTMTSSSSYHPPSASLPFPGTSAVQMPSPAGPSASTTSSSVPTLASSPGSWMAAYAASGPAMLDDGSRTAMIWPPAPLPAQSLSSTHPPAGSGYSSPGSSSRRARIQKAHQQSAATDLPPRRGYHSAAPVSTSDAELTSSSAATPGTEEDKADDDNDPEYVDKDYSSGDADYSEHKSSSSNATSTSQAGSRGKKRKSTDPAGRAASARATTQAKVFQCTGFGDCSMVFSRSEHLARHIRKHTGERPFKCRCGRAFSRLDNLRQHTQTVHHDQPKKNAEMLERLATVHASLSATASKQHKGMSVPIEVARNARASSSSKSSSGSSSVSSEDTVRRRAAEQLELQQEQEQAIEQMTMEEEAVHAMLRRSASVHPPPPPPTIEHTYYPASHYAHRGSGSSESTASDFSISPCTPATRLPMLPHFGPHEGYHYRPLHHEAVMPRYTASMSAPPAVAPVRGKEGYVTLPPIRPMRPLLPPLGAMLPVPMPDRIYPASFPPATYPISPYFTNATHAAWRAGLSYATAANVYAHARTAEEHTARVGTYDYRDYIVHEEDESVGASYSAPPMPPHNELNREALELRQSNTQDGEMARSASFDESPPSFEVPQQRATSSEDSFEALQADALALASLPHLRMSTITQQDITGSQHEGDENKAASGLTAAGNPYHWHMPLVSGVDYFAGHSRAISAERSTTTPLIAQLTPASENAPPIEVTQKMSLKALLASPEDEAKQVATEDAIFDEKDFRMRITD